jgi:hypothetical protein
MARRYYLNDFPEPFVVNGKPDFAVIFGEDSRLWLGKGGGPPKTIYNRSAMEFSDITDAVNFMNLCFLLGRAGFNEVPQDCVFVRNWLDDHDLGELKKRNLILVGSGRVNSLWRSYEQSLRDTLTLRFEYDKTRTPQAIVDRGRTTLYRSEDKDGEVGFVQIAANPNSPGKVILFIAGFHGAGTSGACLALAKRLEDINAHSNVIACITKPARAKRLGDVFDDAQILDVMSIEETANGEEHLEMIEEREHLKWLLKRHRKNLRMVEKKKVVFAGEAPIWLVNQEDYIENEIKEIEEKLETLRG